MKQNDQIQSIYEQNNPQKQQIDIQTQQRHKQMMKLISSKRFTNQYNDTKLPTIRKILEFMNKNNQIIAIENSISTEKILNLDQSYSSINSKNTNRHRRSISKLIEIKKQEILFKDQDQDLIKNAIYKTIQDINSCKYHRAFYSNSPKMQNSSIKNIKKSKQRQNPKYETISFINDSQKINKQTSRQSNKQINKTADRFCNKNKLSSQISKSYKQKAYIQTLNNLEIRPKFHLQKKNYYHTIQAQKTSKKFYSLQNTSRKLSVLLHQASLKQSTELEKSNIFVERLINKKSNKQHNLVGQLVENKRQSISIKLNQSQDYKAKQKCFYNNTQTQRQYIGQSPTKVTLNLLPQIKSSRNQKVIFIKNH